MELKLVSSFFGFAWFTDWIDIHSCELGLEYAIPNNGVYRLTYQSLISIHELSTETRLWKWIAKYMLLFTCNNESNPVWTYFILGKILQALSVFYLTNSQQHLFTKPLTANQQSTWFHHREWFSAPNAPVSERSSSMNQRKWMFQAKEVHLSVMEIFWNVINYEQRLRK
jgi:hypothetical protein